MTTDPATVADTEDGDDDDDELLRDAIGMRARRAPAVVPVGVMIDDAYRIIALIGEGGMGRVYRAHDVRLDRDVALKLHASVAHDARLMREATALAQLVHPNVITVYEVGTWNGHPWVAMAYVPGGTARTWLADRTRTPREIIALYVAAARGLAAAHAAGLVHRDFKPDNVLVGNDGRVCVADFGLVSAIDEITSSSGDARPPANLTATGSVMGTPGYMAPEQCTRAPVTVAADQYAFAVALWEALTGSRPGATTKAPARWVERILRRALAEDPGERWPSVADLADALERHAPRVRRAAISAVAVVLAAGAGAFALSQRASLIDCAHFAEPAWTPAKAVTLQVRLGTHAQVESADLARVTDTLGAWSKARAQEAIGACEATHVHRTRSVEALDQTVACLGRADVAFASTLDVLGQLPAKARDRAVEIAHGLPPVDECRDAREPIGDVVATSRGAAVEFALAQTRALSHAGNVKAELASARRALAMAEQLADKPLRSDAHLALAIALSEAGTFEGVMESCEQAARLAAEAHDDRRVSAAWLHAFHILISLGKVVEAQSLRSVAETAVVRSGNPVRDQALLKDSEGQLAIVVGETAKGLALEIEAAKLTDTAYPADHPVRAQVHMHLGDARSAAHDEPAARAEYALASKILEETYGEANPHLGVVLNQLGVLEYDAEALPEARADLSRALAIKERAVGPTHLSLVPVLVNLGLVEIDEHRFARARAYADRALAIALPVLGPKAPKLAVIYSLFADAADGELAWRTELEMLERALAVHPPRPSLVAELTGELAVARARVGDRVGARGAAAQAVELAARLGDPYQLALATARQGQMLAEANDPAARATLSRGVAALEQVAPGNRETRRLEQFLASHSR